jgi:D-alanyl-D-alanine carboxypeptidase
VERANGRHGRVLAVAAALVAVAGCSSSGDQSVRVLDRPDFQRSLQTLAQQSHAGAVALVRTDEGVWRGAAGFAEGKRRATPADRFGIASTTKTFVATVVLQLAGEGRLSLDDGIGRWFPGLLPDRRRITVRQLLNHTSGLPDFGVSGTVQEATTDLNQSPLISRPGTEHAYSNMNYTVLGLIIEAVTGHGLALEVRDRIFEPVGLYDTGYGPVRPKESAERLPAWLGLPQEQTGPVSGAGGITATADDLASFWRALFGGQLLNPELLAEMTRSVPANESDVRAGLGLFRLDLRCGVAWGHGGDQFTYSDMPLAAPDGSKIVVVAQNTGGWLNARAVAEEMYCS